MVVNFNKLLIFLGFFALAAVSSGQTHKTDQIEVDLVSETTTVVPGETFWLGMPRGFRGWGYCLADSRVDAFLRK